jgi:hypothetical protein
MNQKTVLAIFGVLLVAGSIGFVSFAQSVGGGGSVSASNSLLLASYNVVSLHAYPIRCARAANESVQGGNTVPVNEIVYRSCTSVFSVVFKNGTEANTVMPIASGNLTYIESEQAREYNFTEARYLSTLRSSPSVPPVYIGNGISVSASAVK